MHRILIFTAWICSLHCASAQNAPKFKTVPPALPDTIAQWHYVGSEDRNVPPALVRAALAQSPSARLRELPGVGHVEGWRQAWPALLREIDGGTTVGAH